MKKIHWIFLSLFLIWGCGGSGDSSQAPVVSEATLSITWNMSQSATVEENLNGATLIDATLNNSTAGLSFSLSGTDSSKFSISTGYLVFTDMPDYENPLDSNADNSYSLTISAAGAGISSSHAFTINVTNVNEKPTFTTANTSAFSVGENSTSVKTIVAADPENDSLTFSLEDSSDSQDEGLLQINSVTGAVSFKVAPNFEIPTDIDSNNSLTFTVVASDGSLSSSKEFYAQVTNVAEAPTNITISNSTVPENSPGALFGILNIEDEDLNIKNIKITGDGCFNLDTDLNLSFCSGVSADYENKSSYLVEITLEDNGGFTLVDTLTLSITDVNEASTNVTLTGGTAPENSAGVSFGTLNTTDPDASDTFTYNVTGGTDETSFEIGTGDILKFKSTVSANFETKSSYTVTVTSIDAGSLSFAKSLTVSITNVNESPTDISLSGGSAAENLTGASFGTLSSSDPDSSESFSYSVTGGTDASSFEIGSSNTLKFKSSVSANFEEKSSYSVTVTSTDTGSNTYAETLTVSITNVNEAPSFTTSTTSTIAENGTAVLTVAASDPESGSLTYSLGESTGYDTAKFSITSAGVLTFNRAPDYEIPSDVDENNVYIVNIIVSDGTSSTTLIHHVYITNVEEAAGLETPDNVQTVETK